MERSGTEIPMRRFILGLVVLLAAESVEVQITSGPTGTPGLPSSPECAQYDRSQQQAQ